MKLIDLTGQRFGRLVVEERAPSRKRGDGTSRAYWLCRCMCERGTSKEVEAFALRTGVTKSCGCLQLEQARGRVRAMPVDLTGQQFGRLVVVKRALSRKRANGKWRAYWLCQCTCNLAPFKEVEAAALRSGLRKSCGCLHLECTPVIDRITEKLFYDHGCWTWAAGTTMEGYAMISEGGQRGKRFYVHRVMYELEYGKILPGFDIDHLCRNHACCNPLHLEAVTRLENSARGIGPALTRERAKRRTHCVHGHVLTGDNLYIRPNGVRVCRTCQAARARKQYVVRVVTWQAARQGAL